MLAVMFTLACNTGSLPDRPAGVRTSPVVTAQAKCDDLVDGPASKCTLSFSDVAITVSGTGDLVATAGTAVTRAKVPFDEGNLDNVVYYTSYQGDLLLLFDVSNGETGWGGVARLRGPDFNAVWHVKIPAFNIGPATLEGPSLYVSGIGFIARVDVDRGRYGGSTRDFTIDVTRPSTVSMRRSSRLPRSSFSRSFAFRRRAGPFRSRTRRHTRSTTRAIP